MNKIQSFYLHERITMKPNGWKLVANNRWARLARLAWRFLHWTDCLKQEYEEEVQIIRLPSPEGVLESIFQQKNGLLDIYRKPKEILIGPQTFSQLLRQPEVANVTRPLALEARGYYNGTAFDLPVRIVPQMEGILVLDR